MTQHTKDTKDTLFKLRSVSDQRVSISQESSQANNIYDIRANNYPPSYPRELSDSAHLDWKLSHHFTPPVSMEQHRMNNPKPSLFDLIHQWNLTEEQQEELDFYKLGALRAASVEQLLREGDNKIFHAESGRTYIPIYQYTSRQQVKHDSQGFGAQRYYLSFRAIGATNIVLIQRSRYAS